MVPIINPKVLSLVTTLKCTAACKSCCFSCNIQKDSDYMSFDDMVLIIDEVVSSYKTINLLVLTGGECFLLGNTLPTIIKYATNKNLNTRIVSNAYWAKSFRHAYKELSLLKECGLTELNISTGDEHLRFVPYEFIINAISASLRLGIHTVLNIETNPNKSFSFEKLSTEPRMVKYKNNSNLNIINGLWIDYDSIEKGSHNYKHNIEINNTPCRNLFESINIMPNFDMVSCCGLSVNKIGFLNLGNVKKHSIKKLYESQFDDFVKVWLYTKGPLKIAETICNTNPYKYNSCNHICEICFRLFSDINNIDRIKEKYKDQKTNVLMSYFFSLQNH